jgi:hypothetical protein
MEYALAFCLFLIFFFTCLLNVEFLVFNLVSNWLYFLLQTLFLFFAKFLKEN